MGAVKWLVSLLIAVLSAPRVQTALAGMLVAVLVTVMPGLSEATANAIAGAVMVYALGVITPTPGQAPTPAPVQLEAKK